MRYNNKVELALMWILSKCKQYQELKDKKDFKIIDRKAHSHKTQDTNIKDTILYFGDEKAMSVGDGKAFKADEVALNLPQMSAKWSAKGLNFLAIL